MRQPLRLKHRDAGITLLNACRDPALFGPWFKNQHTWRAWRVFLRALFGLPFMPGDAAIYRRHTGREKPPRKQAKEAWLIVGRRGGKSFVVALVAVFLACFRDYTRYLSPGERATVMALACDRKQARVVMRYVTALLEEVSMLSRMVESFGSESIDLSNRVTIEVHTASFRSVRGYTVAAAILDEIAFWRSEDSANPDTEIVAALRPAMTTIPGALLLGISSPYGRRGVLWDAYRDHYGQDGPVLVWKADTRSMNPTIPQSEIDRAYEEDPTAAAAEHGADFRADIEGFLDPAWLDAAVREGLHEIPPAPGKTYVAWADPSGGKRDSFTLSIAHNEGGRLILNVCRARRPPFNPLTVVAEFSHVLKDYRLARVTGDRYSAEFVVSAFRENGISYEPSERSASDVYLEVLPYFAQGSIQLLDNRTLLHELRQLERRTGQAKDVVSHPLRAHDDSACSACGALLLSVRHALPENTQFLTADRAETAAAIGQHLVEDLGFAEDIGGDPSPFDRRFFDN